MSKTKHSSKDYFDTVTPTINFPALEEEVLTFWKENKTFERSVSSKPADKRWTFLDGPPFITGLPHYGSILSSISKDVFPRYWTMKGYRVRRVWGWDCHGLPAENKVENKLGLSDKREIEEKVGMKKFIEECKTYVSQTSSEWDWYIDHVGRWVDFENAYKTMDTDYMESVMWVFKQMYEKDYIYKGLRVSLYCPHCQTPISNFEVAMDAGENYKDVTETATTYKYKVKNEDNTYFLAWSTTPWNKIATPALAVNEDIPYVKVQQGTESYILAKSALKILQEKPKYTVVNEMKGSDLVGMEFEPHFDYYSIEKGNKAFVIVGAPFVTADEGTGIVTLAAYGEDDLEVMKKEKIQIVTHVKDDGHLVDEVPKWGGMYYLKVNPLVDDDLEERGLVYNREAYIHSVAHCWRCQTQLIHNPQNAWFVDVQSLKKTMKETNEGVNWYPDHFKYGRFLKSMESAPDWCISRSRYWGSPVPVWECECGERFVPGSIKELEKRSGVKLVDLHKPEIDDVVVKCDSCGSEMRRVPEVLDSWIEAGSASFAERHFPFDETQKLEDFFPPDFISEYTGQIRAWFYVIHVISAALYKSSGFKNVLVTGVILGSDGRKMSKNYGNYPDPKEMLQKYGGDALRLYLLGSPIMKGEDVLISEEVYSQQVRNFSLLLWNVYRYFITYVSADKWKPSKRVKSKNVLDRWVLIRLAELQTVVTHSLDTYNTVDAVKECYLFLNDVSRWYVRRSRDRVGSAESENDKLDFYQSMYTILVEFMKVLAPIAPFVSENIYKNLTKEESVHLADWPEVAEITEDDKHVVTIMAQAREIVELAHAARKEKEIPVRQPLSTIEVSAPFPEFEHEYIQIILDELNIKACTWKKTENLSIELDTTITPELEEEAKTRELARKVQNERKNMGLQVTDIVSLSSEWLPTRPELISYLKTKASIGTLSKGEFEVKVEV